MAEVVIIVPTREMHQNSLEILDELNLDAKVFVEDSSSVLFRVTQAQKDGALVAVARGNHANLILNNLDIPLVEIRLSGQSIAILISQAKKLTDKKRPVIAFLGFPNMLSDIKAFEDILEVNVREYLVTGSGGIPEAVNRAAKDGADVLISGQIGMDAAERIGLPAVFLRSSKEDLVSAFRNAKRLLYAIELEKKNTVEVTTLLNYSFDGIIKLDPEGIITKANYMAERIFRRGAHELVGQPLVSFFDEQDSQSIKARLASSEKQQSFMLHKGRVSLIANLVNLLVSGISQGAILSFQEFGAIEAMEETIRQDRYSRVQKALRHFSDISSESPCYKQVLQEAQHYAQFDLSLLLLGEVGVGKRTLAECIHNASLRRNNPFIAMDCAGMPESMQEEMLSGNEQNSVFKSAHTGTLFIDNVHRLTPAAQYQLLSGLRDGVIWQMDRMRALPVNVRVIAATCVDIDRLAFEENFNLPLYTMLSQFSFYVPSLRERPEDIQLLADQYLARYCTKYRKHLVLSPEARQAIAGFHWPGNLMQLNLYAEKLVLLATEKVITLDFVLKTLPGSLNRVSAPRLDQPKQPMIIYRSPEAETILKTLEKHAGNRAETAKELGISKTTLWRKMKENDIQGSFRLRRDDVKGGAKTKQTETKVSKK